VPAPDGLVEGIVPSVLAAELDLEVLGRRTPRVPPGTEALLVDAFGRRLLPWAIRGRFAALRARSGLKITPHDLRGAGAAHCQSAGMSLREIQELLGHADLKNTARYTGFDRAELRAVVERCHPRSKLRCPRRP